MPSRRPTGRTVTPSASSGNIRYTSPWCGLGGPSPRARPAASYGSQRNRPNARSAKAARDDHAFWPPISQPPSVRRAVDRSEARSEPASGSDQAWAQITSPVAMGGSTRARCSAVPWSKRVGASRLMPFCETRPGAPAAWYSSSNSSHLTRSTPCPPNSSGQETTDQRPAASTRSHARWAAKPASVSRDGSGATGTCAASHSRARRRNSRSSALKSRSIGGPPPRSLAAESSLTSVW
ncbi:hypothetical protein SALBM135S_09867 [Streptomyces alboniger]